ncbi:enoyl-CoA hydratase/isomerase family protein [Rhodobacteraceae bacterium D3-12]|nr:enoyl-CoA hydratase/isomerase family protein [Rhodobacteraceae bacterium D3-12]
MIRYEKQGDIAVMTFDNPPLNVLTPDDHKRLFEILQDFTADRDIRCGVLTGSGERAFSAGDDIKTERPMRTREEVVERHLTPSRAFETAEYPGWEAELLTMPRHKPIVGAINGYCLGQGFLYMSMLTDIRYASKTAQFGLPEIAYGMGGAGGMLSLGKQIPHAAAMEILLLGKIFSAERAEELSLINEVVDADALMETAMAAARQIASHPPMSVRVEMETYQRSQDMSRADSMALAMHMYRLARSVQPRDLPLTKGKGE